MATIDGLSEEQCHELRNIQIGDLILIESYPKDDEGYDDDTDDDDGAGVEQDESDSDMESDSDPGSESAEGEDSDGHNDDADEINEDASEDSTEVVTRGSEHDEQLDGNDDVVNNQETENSYTTNLYRVLSVSKDADGSITNLSLCVVTYSSKPANATSSSYHIYGSDVVPSNIALAGAEESYDIGNVMNDESKQYDLYVNCTGDNIRNIVFHGRCPARCNEGWVSAQHEMHEMVNEAITTVAEHQPVCPVCMGKALMLEYQSLREMLETAQGGMIDLGAVVEFHGRLNPRRRQLGYGFKQFDEREWGYMFDDMNSDDEESEDGGGGNTDGWGYWQEALDPSSCVVPRPASDTAIAALPRKTFAEARQTSEETECLVCKEKFADEVVVAELPCGHFFCDADCIEHWLKESNNCPTCRRKLPSKEDEQVAKISGTASEAVGGSLENSTNEEIDGNEANGTGGDTEDFEKDGEDAVMSDVEDVAVA